ncbi:MAG: sensor histidine kinase [Brevundimonas sp.]|uniref:sensor histidine kinase PhyK n=1 Tax=Brevundimonas sp. TaxID=1871086 RepID=UPI003918E114
MAVALLPILLLSAVQTQSAFQRESEDRRHDLVLAAERSAATAKARLDSATVLLEVLRPEALGLYCAPRLRALVTDLDGYDALYRFSPTGRVACASTSVQGDVTVRNESWFARIQGGEPVVLTRAPDGLATEPSLLAAVRSERPLGAFDGVLVAVIPLSALQPDVSDRALPEGTQVALTDASGAILTATDADAFRTGEPDGLTGWVERARQGAFDFRARDSSGRNRLYAGAALAGRDVYVLLSTPDPGLLSWAQLNPTGTLLLPLAAWLMAFLAVMIFTERIVIRWLDYLERVASIYAKGRFTVRPVQAENAPAEIRVLARTLDEMAEAIGERDHELTKSLAEKDALMREIHHRVKNNLQIISSLLSMQQRALTDPAARAAIGDTRQRISALALIYRTLYQSEDIREADLADFLRELTGQLIAGESGRGPVVSSEVSADSLIIDPDRLAPLALWAVEAISNAQKHAFAERGGSLKVRFRVLEDRCVLEVEDDGPGAGAAALVDGVGGTLMTAFARQLRGTLDFDTPEQGGMIARLTFPKPGPPPSSPHAAA